MYAGIVAGTVVATVKDERLANIPLLIVRKIEDGKEADLVVAADHTCQAGMGDYVYMIGSKEATRIYRDRELPPADVSIVGFIDDYHEEL